MESSDHGTTTAIAELGPRKVIFAERFADIKTLGRYRERLECILPLKVTNAYRWFRALL